MQWFSKSSPPSSPLSLWPSWGFFQSISALQPRLFPLTSSPLTFLRNGSYHPQNHSLFLFPVFFRLPSSGFSIPILSFLQITSRPGFWFPIFLTLPIFLQIASRPGAHNLRCLFRVTFVPKVAAKKYEIIQKILQIMIPFPFRMHTSCCGPTRLHLSISMFNAAMTLSRQ